MGELGKRVTVSAKGHVRLGRAVLDHLGARPGDKLILDLLPGGRVELRTESKRSIEDFFGFLERPGQKALTIEEINDVIAKGWAGEP